MLPRQPRTTLFPYTTLFRSGPESAGAVPGPAAYRRGGPLTVTDCNVMLGKLRPDQFPAVFGPDGDQPLDAEDRKSTRLNSSHSQISYAVFCLKKKKEMPTRNTITPTQSPMKTSTTDYT